jgi:hypothetical protein
MQKIFDMLNTVGFFSLLSTLIILYITKNKDKKIEKDINVFEKKREALTCILSMIAETIISIKSNYNIEYDRFNLISEKSCDEFEINIQKYVLYLTNDDIYILKYIFELLRDNASWQYNYVPPEENAEFSMKDLDVIEYLYIVLVNSFRNQLFEAKLKKNVNILEIKYLKISSFLQKTSSNMKLNQTLIKLSNKFSYKENTIKDTITYFRNNVQELILLLDDIKKVYAKKKIDSTYYRKCYEEIEQYISIIKNKNN